MFKKVAFTLITVLSLLSFSRVSAAASSRDGYTSKSELVKKFAGKVLSFIGLSAAASSLDGYTSTSELVRKFVGKNLPGVSSDKEAVEFGITQIESVQFSLFEDDPDLEAKISGIRATIAHFTSEDRARWMAVSLILSTHMRQIMADFLEGFREGDKSRVTVLNDLKQKTISHARTYLVSLENGIPNDEELEKANQFLKQLIELCCSTSTSNKLIIFMIFQGILGNL
jgi:hypothetical protein